MNIKAFIQNHPVATYFGIAFLISWISFLILVGPKLVQGKDMYATDAFIMFPVMVIGVGLTGLILTRVVDGRSGLRELLSRMGRWRVGVPWYVVALLIPPVFIVAVLSSLRTLISPQFTPNFFPLGISFGLLAGFFEEIGWTGYAFPRMQSGRSPLSAAILLGVLWGLWHMPVVDYLGAATPHGAYWLPFFLAFVVAIIAMRVLICWVYSNTRSVLLAQLMHVSSTGFLVVFSPPRLSPGQETFWYAVYAAALWIAVAIVVAIYGKRLTQQPTQARAIQLP